MPYNRITSSTVIVQQQNFPPGPVAWARGNPPSPDFGAAPRRVLPRSRPKPAFGNGANDPQDYYYASPTKHSHNADS